MVDGDDTKNKRKKNDKNVDWVLYHHTIAVASVFVWFGRFCFD